jgi:hypothetical protein
LSKRERTTGARSANSVKVAVASNLALSLCGPC